MANKQLLKTKIMRLRYLLMALCAHCAVTNAAPLNVNYTYDPIGRLTAVQYDQAPSVGYNYDAAGNLSNVSAGGSGVLDTTRPSVVDINSTSVGTIRGDVTLTFTFNEPVTGFSAEGIILSQGTKGLFLAQSDTTYTLVVTPPPNSVGDLHVSVREGVAFDSAANPNQPALASLMFDTTSSVPGAATITSVIAGDHVASIYFAPAATGWASVSSLNAVCSPISGGASVSIIVSTPSFPMDGSQALTVTGLTNGTGYQCSLAATNSVGTGLSSGLSAVVTPLVPTSTPTTVQLAKGWNLVGNGSQKVIDVVSQFGDASRVNSVWKWISASGQWAFYSPLNADGGAAYAQSKGYHLLAAIAPGEGYWVNINAEAGLVLPVQEAGPVAATSHQNLGTGWHLIAVSGPATPAEINETLAAVSSEPDGLVSVWAWDTSRKQWYFWAPGLAAQGGSALQDYLSQMNYLDFATLGRTLQDGTGFWIRRSINEAPTVRITDNTAGTATGDVIFTFTFSKPVTGFTAADISVVNGSVGAFSTVSPSVYTLLVSPPPNDVGTITVNVAAGVANDAAGLGNTAATQAEQAFITTPDTGDGGTTVFQLTGGSMGSVRFVDDAGATAPIPADAMVRIVPLRFQNDASGWDGPLCKISLDTGAFGNECVIYGDPVAMGAAFADPSETFQVVVFRNHIDPGGQSWNCGEDTYRYVGQGMLNGSWSSIQVRPIDYGDRSGDVCQ